MLGYTDNILQSIGCNHIVNLSIYSYVQVSMLRSNTDWLLLVMAIYIYRKHMLSSPQLALIVIHKYTSSASSTLHINIFLILQ